MPFNGINNLRAANESVRLKPWQLAEIKKCAQDPLYFMNNYMYINTKDNGMQLFKTYPFQDEAVKRFLKYRFNINRWSRQVGKSTIVRGFILWYAMFHGDQLVAMLANKLSLAKEQLQLLRDSYIALPFWLQPGVKLWNKMSIQFSNNTRILVAPTTVDGIRGFSPNLLYLDEFAFLRTGLAEEFWTSNFPSISSGKKTRVIITSCVTPDTLVYTDKGICEVGEFIDRERGHGGYEIPDYNVCGFEKGMNHGSIMHNEGVVDTLTVKCRYAELTGSTMHKYYACKDGVYGVYRAHELREGDYIAVRYGMDAWGDDRIDYVEMPCKKHITKIGNIESITPDLAYLFGLYIAEGNITIYKNKHRSCYILTLTCGDDLHEIFDRLNLRYHLSKDGLHYQVSSKSLIDLFLHVGFDPNKHAKEKEIPLRLLKMSKPCMRAMLQGMFDGDGCATTKKKYKIGYASTSRKLITQLRAILLNFGILSTMGERDTRPTERAKVWSHSYVIEIDQIDMVNKFFTDIGFRFNRKQCQYNPDKSSKRIGCNNDIIPFAIQELKRLKKARRIPYSINIGPTFRGKLHTSRGTMLSIINRYKDTVDFSGTFCDYVRDDIIWAPIDKITKGHEFVCDFSLDDNNSSHCHSVVYNGILGHQTPCGMNLFYNLWEGAVDEKTASYHDLTSKFVKSTVIWSEVPGRDAQWGIDEMARIGEQKFRQEYECEFVGSAITLIDYKILQKLKPTNPIPLAGTPRDYQIRMYQKPMSPQKMELNNWIYVASIDTGYGIRKDYHVLHILLAKSSVDLEEVFVMSSNTVTVEDFCARAYLVLNGYGQPPLTIEYNGPGARTYGIMFNDLQYERLVNYDNKLRGMWATDNIKQSAVMLLKLYVERFYLKLHDEMTINELMSFTALTQSCRKWGASGGNHDDNVTSLYWCVYYAASPWFEGNQEELSFMNGIELAFTAIGEAGNEASRALEFVKDQIAQKEQAALGQLQQNQSEGQEIAEIPSGISM